MCATKALFVTLVLCFQTWSADAIFINIVRPSNSTNATTTFNPVGAIAATAIGAGAAVLGTVAVLAVAGGGIRRPFRRFGRSLQEPATNVELALALVESLDANGCAKRLLCEEAGLGVQRRDAAKASPTDQGFLSNVGSDDEDLVFDVDANYDDESLDKLGEVILNFVRNKDGEEIAPGSSREKWLAVVKFGEEGGDCTSSPCPLNRKEILRNFQLRGLQ